MTTMTLEERERRAYADGRVEEAALLGLAIDFDSERILDLTHDLVQAETTIEKLEAESWQAGLDQAAAYLRSEATRLRSQQSVAFDGNREKMIDKLNRMARVVVTLK